MPQIVTNTFFINDLHIPHADDVQEFGVESTPITQLNDCCVWVEKELLLNSLGLTLYNDLQTALVNITEAEQKWKDLVNGVQYDGKIWEGLSNPKTFIAYAVYYKFLNMESDYWTTFGVVKADAANAINTTPFYKLTAAWNKFLQKYQSGYCAFRDYYSGLNWEFIDWHGSHDDINVSLYEYLRDKADVYSWNPEYFKYYESVNTFGI